MRAVVQRVANCQVSIDGQQIGQIGQGLLALLAIAETDQEASIYKMAEKILNLRIFADRNDKMNLSVKEIDGSLMVVSQFTLYGDATKGNRPSFITSAKPEKAKLFYQKFIDYLKQSNLKVATGEFGAKMQVELTNDGPVTIIIDL